MKEECKLCSVNGWGCTGQGSTDFSISSLMRPTAHHSGQVEPRHDAVLLSTYLFKLGDYPLYTLHDYHSSVGYYQPAGPLIKETSADAERALGRYPPPHYHPHPPMLQQYGQSYYPTELCYGRYYGRPPRPYHIPPPQQDAQMVSVGSEPYPPPQYYGTPPCYQHSPQRIPYVEYRGCPCPLNACPKNVLIGPVTGKAPTGSGPADVHSALAPPGAAFRPKVRACALDSAADTHGSGKDPPLESEPPAAADAPHPCSLPSIGGASPKRELYDIRENLRLVGDIPGSAEALGPPSPARGSAGACAPQPPPIAPRRARLGKAMARRTLTGDDTGLLLSAPQVPITHHSDADDDVLAISPPVCIPIDLSSSDERSTPLVDVKKENEGPTYTPPRKADAQALKEHNSTIALSEGTNVTDTNKAIKRRYSKPKLDINMKDIQLEDSCKTNGIGEHVKLQKRRKLSGDQTDIVRTETITKDSRRKGTPKRTPSNEKKLLKRKLENTFNEKKAKKLLVATITDEDTQKNVTAVPLCYELIPKKPKTKSALLLDNLIRKNSIERTDAKGYASDTDINPAELFLSPSDIIAHNSGKKTLNINNNIVDNNNQVNTIRPKAIAAVNQIIEKKLSYKNACKEESNITHNFKSVLKSPTGISTVKDRAKQMILSTDPVTDSAKIGLEGSSFKNTISGDNKVESPKENEDDIKTSIPENLKRHIKTYKAAKRKMGLNKSDQTTKSLVIVDCRDESQNKEYRSLQNKKNDLRKCLQSNHHLDKISMKKPNSTSTEKLNGEIKGTNVEQAVKLLVPKKVNETAVEEKQPKVDLEINVEGGKGNKGKLCKLGVEKESKCKGAEVVKLIVSKKNLMTTDETSLIAEDSCASPTPSSEIIEEVDSTESSIASGGRSRRRRTGTRRLRRKPAALPPPALQARAPPRWSNGWNWDGDHYVSKVYLNNDPRLDRTARCWSRMTHASGDRVARGDCVLLRASLGRAQPFVARVASLWENPDDGEMMLSLVWYYRPEHTDRGRQPGDAADEVFASRHRDANSVACIEDKCYVLTFNEYCRKRLKAAEEDIEIAPSIVPPMPANEVTSALAPNDTKLPPSVSPELVLFCRKIYDFRSKKIHVPNK